jgi:16S rRNA (adenine1518-N6/adenine1519-N6)-dimethyltransferase
MSVEETKQLLRTYRISPNKLLGQNFMVEPSLYPKLCTYASLDLADVVLDAGSGFGFFACFLADKCKKVIAVEKDPQVARVLREQVKGIGNVEVIEGDVLKEALPQFNKVIAIPPYYLSSRLVTWILERKVDCAVLILQKEFAERLIAPVGSEAYGWLTVVTCQSADAELLNSVPKTLFFPEPEVDSAIVRLKPWINVPFEVKDEALFRRMAKWLFTERNKKVGNALEIFIKSTLKLSKQEVEKIIISIPSKDRRVRELAPKEFGALANALSC